MKTILKLSILLLFLNLLCITKSRVKAVPLHSGTTEFFVTEEVRVKRQAGYVYNKPSVSFNLPSQAPTDDAPTESTQAPTVDRTQAQMMYYAYPAPQPTVKNSEGSSGGPVIGYSTGASAGTGAASAAGYNYKLQNREPAGAQPASFMGSSQASAGTGPSTGSSSSGYAYDTPTTGTNSISSGSQFSTGSTSSEGALNTGAGYASSVPVSASATPKVDVSTNAPQYLPPSADRSSLSSGTPSVALEKSGGGYSSGSPARSENAYSDGSLASSGGGYSSDSSTGSGGAFSGGSSGGAEGGYSSGSPAGSGVAYSDSSSNERGGGYSSGSSKRPEGRSSSGGTGGGYSRGSSAGSGGGYSGGSSGGTSGVTSGSLATALLSDQYLPPLSQPKPLSNAPNVPSVSAGKTDNSPTSIPNSAYVPPNRPSSPSVNVDQQTGSGPISSAPNSAYIPPNISSSPSSNPNFVPSINIGQKTGNGPISSVPNSSYIPPSRSPSALNPTPRPFAPAKPSSEYLPPNSSGTQTQGSISTPASMYLPPVF